MKLYDDQRWRIYYLPVSDFTTDLRKLGQKLTEIEDEGDQVFAVIPNIGFTVTGYLVGGVSGVTGFAIIVKKKRAEIK